MEAFTAGKVDAVMMTMGDALVTGAPGARSVAILVTDYSNGNDMIVAQARHHRPQGPQGQEDRPRDWAGRAPDACSRASKRSGLKETDVKLVNVSTNQTAASLASKDVDAIGAWQPNSGRRLKAVAGSKAMLTSKDTPGLIYDLAERESQEPCRATLRLG